MILRLVSSLLIVFLVAAIFILPKTNLKNNFPIFTSPRHKTATPADPLKIYPHPVRNQNFADPPELTAKSAIVIDATDGVVLYEKNPNIRLLPASTTKLMTALVALENCSSQKVVTVGSFEKDGSMMGLKQGDSLTVKSLLYGLLIPSGNDAAQVLAAACADSSKDFIAKMNEKAKELGMENTHFMNPVGYDSDFHYSTARDLAKLAKVAVANPLISKIVSIKSTVVTDVTVTRTYYLENVNKLLGSVDGMVGIKTGETEGALEILISKTTRNNHSIITVLLGSEHRFDETKELIEWSFANYHWKNPT